MVGRHETGEDRITSSLIESLLGNLAANQGLLADLVAQQKAIAVSLAQVVETQRAGVERMNYVFRVPEETQKLLSSTLAQHTKVLDEMWDRMEASDKLLAELRMTLGTEYARAIKDEVGARATSIVSALNDAKDSILDKIESTGKETGKNIISTVVLRITVLLGSIVTILGLIAGIIQWLLNLSGKGPPTGIGP